MLKILDFWYIPVALVIGVFAFFWIRDRRNPLEVLKLARAELAAISAKREARDIKLQLGHEQAKQHVLDKYREARQALDAEQEARIKELENDPEKLSAAMERLIRQ